MAATKAGAAARPISISAGRRRKTPGSTSSSAASAPAAARRPAISRAGSARRARSRRSGFVVGALVAVNAAGKATRGSSPRFWAAAYERADEFGGLGEGAPSDDALVFALKRDDLANTTLAVVATDAPLDKAQATRLATMATAGFALALRPAHAPTDGDVVFAASTARAALTPDLRDLAEIGALAAECLARAIARGVYEATPLPFDGAMASWKGKWGSRQ